MQEPDSSPQQRASDAENSDTGLDALLDEAVRSEQALSVPTSTEFLAGLNRRIDGRGSSGIAGMQAPARAIPFRVWGLAAAVVPLLLALLLFFVVPDTEPEDVTISSLIPLLEEIEGLVPEDDLCEIIDTLELIESWDALQDPVVDALLEVTPDA